MKDVFQALSSSIRRQILSYLSESGLTAGEIAERFNISKPALSKHLSVLENAGLIRSEKVGQYVHYYIIKDSLVTSLFDFLSDFCPVGAPLKKEGKQLAQKKGAKIDKVIK